MLTASAHPCDRSSTLAAVEVLAPRGGVSNVAAGNCQGAGLLRGSRRGDSVPPIALLGGPLEALEDGDRSRVGIVDQIEADEAIRGDGEDVGELSGLPRDIPAEGGLFEHGSLSESDHIPDGIGWP